MITRVEIDRTLPAMASRLRVGVTLTKHTPAESWIGTPEARERANAHVEAMRSAWVNVHIAGWGIDANKLWSAPDKRDWTEFDRRMLWLVECKIENVVLTCYGAPDWATVTGKTTKYRMLAQAHEATYAALCVEAIGRAIDLGVRVVAVQFWNEMKGYGNFGGDWDIAAYTRAYNLWYEAIKAHDELDGLLLAGPYMILENGAAVVTTRNLETLRYWDDNALGADAVAVVHALSHAGTGLLDQASYMRGVAVFGTIAQQLRWRHPGREIWFSEHYAHSDTAQYETLDPQFQAAHAAAVLAGMLWSGASLALSWGLLGDGSLAPGGCIASWLTDTRPTSGAGLVTDSGILPGDNTPLYDVYRAFHEHFGPGRLIYQDESSDPLIVALTSDSATMLVNLHDGTKTVRMGTETLSLDRYGVRVLPEPAKPTMEERMQREIGQLADSVASALRDERGRVAAALEAAARQIGGRS